MDGRPLGLDADGFVDGVLERTAVGGDDGVVEGSVVGVYDGSTEGCSLCLFVGASDGIFDGWCDVPTVGFVDGIVVGGTE